MAERWPRLKVEGIDIHEPALALAEENLSVSQVASRVKFKKCDVLQLVTSGNFVAAFIPAIFVPEQVVKNALVKLRDAIEPGGWLFFASFKEPEEELPRALMDLKSTVWGGRVWPIDEATELIGKCGFRVAENIGSQTALNLFAAQKN